jgi:saccharopine dehydrogenase-like NADP-dependent oxidoreductase
MKKKAKKKAVKPKKKAVKPKKKVVSKNVRKTVGGVRGDTLREEVGAEPESMVVDSGDLQGISVTEDVDSESAAELLDEGQGFEAGIISGVEAAPNADQAEMKPRKVPTDFVTGKYKDRNRI